MTSVRAHSARQAAIIQKNLEHQQPAAALRTVGQAAGTEQSLPVKPCMQSQTPSVPAHNP